MALIPTSPDRCPLCSKPGSGISRPILLQHLDPLVMMDVLKWKEASVCLNSSCQCLYFSGGEWLSHLQCNKRVGFKSGHSPRTLCYCFGYTAEDLLKKGKIGWEKALEEIETYLGEGRGACQITNPTGQSCLDPIRNFMTEEKH